MSIRHDGAYPEIGQSFRVEELAMISGGDKAIFVNPLNGNSYRLAVNGEGFQNLRKFGKRELAEAKVTVVESFSGSALRLEASEEFFQNVSYYMSGVQKNVVLIPSGEQSPCYDFDVAGYMVL